MFPRKMIPPGFVEDRRERFSAGGPGAELCPRYHRNSLKPQTKVHRVSLGCST